MILRLYITPNSSQSTDNLKKERKLTDTPKENKEERAWSPTSGSVAGPDWNVWGWAANWCVLAPAGILMATASNISYISWSKIGDMVYLSYFYHTSNTTSPYGASLPTWEAQCLTVHCQVCCVAIHTTWRQHTTQYKRLYISVFGSLVLCMYLFHIVLLITDF